MNAEITQLLDECKDILMNADESVYKKKLDAVNSILARNATLIESNYYSLALSMNLTNIFY